MVDFGFTLSPEKQLNLDDLDNSLFYIIAKREPTILSCIGCGSCKSTCSLSFLVHNSFREAIVHLERGDLNSALKAVNSCVLCGKCSLVCPRGINTRGIIAEIRKSAK